MEDAAGTHPHGSLSNSRKGMAHFKVFNPRVFVQDLFQELSQLGNVPLTVTQLEKDALFRSLRIDGKYLIEGKNGLQHSHLRIQHDQWLLYGFQDALRKIASCVQKMRCSNVGKSHDDAVN